MILSRSDHTVGVGSSATDQLLLRNHHLDVQAYHPPPHFHAQYGEHWAQIGIAEQVMLSGSLPPRALRLVTDWARMHQAELHTDWDLAQTLQPLVPIDPLP